MEFWGKIVREKLALLFGRVVVFARNEGGKFGKLLKEKLAMLVHRFVLFTRNWGRNRGNDSTGGLRPKDDSDGELRPKFEWPYVMNSSVAMHRPIVSGTWIWSHKHARWHHGYYRTRR